MELAVVDAGVGTVAAVGEESVGKFYRSAMTGDDPGGNVFLMNRNFGAVSSISLQVVDILGEVVLGVAARAGLRHLYPEDTWRYSGEINGDAEFVLLHIVQVKAVGNGSRMRSYPVELGGKRGAKKNKEKSGKRG